MSVSMSEIRKHVLSDFRYTWPQATEETNLRNDLQLTNPQIWALGQEFLGWKGVQYKPSEFLACETIRAIELLIYEKLNGKHFTTLSA